MLSRPPHPTTFLLRPRCGIMIGFRILMPRSLLDPFAIDYLYVYLNFLSLIFLLFYTLIFVWVNVFKNKFTNPKIKKTYLTTIQSKSRNPLLKTKKMYGSSGSNFYSQSQSSQSQVFQKLKQSNFALR